MNLMYLYDDIDVVIERILADDELSDSGLGKRKIARCLKSFQGDEIACSVFLKKYALRDDNNIILEFTLEEAKDRWAKAVSTVEDMFKVGSLKSDAVEYFRELYEYFLPAGRQMFALGNTHVKKATLTNCYVTKIEEDSLEGIFDAAKKLARTYSYGGGIGLCIGELRPASAKVSNSARFSTGAASFMELYSLTTGLVGQFGRRGALMITIPVDHPDIENFIEMKHNNLDMVKYANISIKLTDDFMNAVINNEEFVLKFDTYHESITRTVMAKDLWGKIVQSAYDSAEPGLVFWDRAVEMSPSEVYPRLRIHSTNPCVTGDTLIYVADGRGHVSIKQLATENKDIPVFCLSDEDKIVIRYMRNPRITGYKQPVFKVTLDDGNSFKVTKNHQFKLKSGIYKRTDELEKGDSLKMISRFKNGIKNKFGKQTKFEYYWISNGSFRIRAEHRYVAEQFSKWRNDHLGGILGLAKWAAYERGVKNINLDPRSQKHYLKLLAQGYNCIIKDKKIFIVKNCEICGKKYEVHHSHRESGICSKECHSQYIIKRNKNSDIASKAQKNSNNTWQKKKKENAEKQIKAFVDLKFKLGRDPSRKEWECCCKEDNIPCRIGKPSYFEKYKHLKDAASNYNHKVLSVEFCGFEDVYNGTVDEFHNFFTGGFQSRTPSGKEKWYYFNNLNCGEQLLSPGDACVLSSLLLHKFVKKPFTDKANFDYELFEEMVIRGVRHLDNIVELNMGKHGLEEQEEASRLGRRIGLGVTGLGDMYAAMGIKYDSKEALELADSIMTHKKAAEYSASISLAIERGSFPLFDPHKHFSRGFPSTLHPDIINRAKMNGLRNVAISTVAPNGSISIIAQCSSGIEPIFALRYRRFVEMGEKKKKEFTILHQGLARFYEACPSRCEKDCPTDQGDDWNEDLSDLPDHWVVAHDIDYKHRVKLQGVLQKHTDAGISSTINLPKGADIKTVGQIYIDAWREGLKGITVYREGSREGILLTDEFAKLAGSPDMDTAIHCVKAEGGDKFYIMVSYKNKNIREPYQVFVLNYKRAEHDSFVKISNLLIRMLLENGVPQKRVDKYIERSNNSLAKLTRFLSLSMKTGNFEKAVDVLEEHAFVGTLSYKLYEIFSKSIAVKAMVCRNCGGSNMRMEEGCMRCLDCDWSGCT